MKGGNDRPVGCDDSHSVTWLNPSLDECVGEVLHTLSTTNPYSR